MNATSNFSRADDDHGHSYDPTFHSCGDKFNDCQVYFKPVRLSSSLCGRR